MSSSSRSSRSVRVEALARELDLVERREERRASRRDETQNVEELRAVICGPCDVNTTGWMKFCESRIARNETGISTTPKSAYTAHMFARGRPGSTEKRSMKYAQ